MFPHPFNSYGEKPHRLIGEYPALDCFKLADGDSWAAMREAGISIGGTYIALRTHPTGARYFICPRCGRGCYRLHFVAGWACRTCHGLSYRCRHKDRTAPGLHRLLWLRRRIGAGAPFTPIAPKPRNASRYWAAVAEIRQLEAGLIQHLRGVNDALGDR